MNSREEGFLLLTSHLGDAQRRPLTAPQLRELQRCVLRAGRQFTDRDLNPQDLVSLGCSETIAEKTVMLLADLPLLRSYLQHASLGGCVPLSRVSEGYPLKVRKCLDLDAPGCIWLKGNMDLLNRPSVALVGSRNLRFENGQFAEMVGIMAAKHGFVLVSGNARGADSVAQESCLRSGGCVISIVADSLMTKKPNDRVLYISEEGFDQPFTNQRALSRNRIIHAMAHTVFIAQCSNGTGGTWDGTCRNLTGQWSPVYCLADGSAAVARLYKMGAGLTKTVELDKIFKEMRECIVRNHKQCVEDDKMIK